MKKLVPLLVLIAALGPPDAAQSTHYVSPDVPTDDPGGSGTVFMPWDVIGYQAGIYAPAPAVSFQNGISADALHKMDRPGHWLLSVEATAEIPTGGGVYYEPEDVILFDGANYALYFDGSAHGVPAGVNVDAVFLAGDDFGDLVLSFDVPTTIGATTYDPADLVRFAGGAFNLFFDASTAGAGIALSDNVTGADFRSPQEILSMDVPSDLLPSIGPTTYLPGQIAAWDAGPGNFLLHEVLAGWPLASEVDAFSCQANPGRVYERSVYPLPIRLTKSTVTPGNIVILWSPSCSSGAEDYGIYEGTLGAWNSHKRILCTDSPPLLQEDFTPQTAGSYYLVVPHNWVDEGAFGADHDYTRFPPRIERLPPVLAADRCVPSQILSACP